LHENEVAAVSISFYWIFRTIPVFKYFFLLQSLHKQCGISIRAARATRATPVDHSERRIDKRSVWVLGACMHHQVSTSIYLNAESKMKLKNGEHLSGSGRCSAAQRWTLWFTRWTWHTRSRMLTVDESLFKWYTVAKFNSYPLFSQHNFHYQSTRIHYYRTLWCRFYSTKHYVPTYIHTKLYSDVSAVYIHT
jgi:hypothetical protein